MIDYKKTMLAVLGLWAFAPSAFCQNNGVWIGASCSAGIVSVGEMERISFADYGDGGSPSRLGGAGDKEFPHSENWAYEIGQEKDIHAVPLRGVASGKPQTGDFDLWTDKACYKPGETVWIQAARFADYPGATVRYRRVWRC